MLELQIWADWVKAHLRREEGQALVEYALILFLVAVVSVGVLTLLGGKVSSTISRIYNAM